MTKNSELIPKSQLRNLERTVRSLMGEGRYMEGIQVIRKKAEEWGMPSDQLTKLVAELAIDLGHVEPIRMLRTDD